MGEAHDDAEGLLFYNIEVTESKALHVISDPCSKRFPHSIGNGLWQSSLELIDFFSGGPVAVFNFVAMSSGRAACL